jgi:retinol dehydrogenase-12
MNARGDGFDLSGKTCVVTGATDGIGEAAALALLQAGGAVVVVGRSEERGRSTLARLAARVPGAAVSFELCDMASQASIAAFAARYLGSGRPLHVLLNNAGGWSTSRRTSVDGHELTFATNMLGYFATTSRLLPAILRSAPARIVNVASGLARSLDLDDLDFTRRRYRGIEAYAQSKQANRMWTYALSRRLAGRGVTANVMNPGSTRTNAFAKGGGPIAWILQGANLLIAKSAAAGADTAVWLCASPAVEGVTARYFQARREVACPFHGEEAEEALWRRCEELTGLRETALG